MTKSKQDSLNIGIDAVKPRTVKEAEFINKCKDLNKRPVTINKKKSNYDKLVRYIDILK
jgi:hypothetical protein